MPEFVKYLNQTLPAHHQRVTDKILLIQESPDLNSD